MTDVVKRATEASALLARGSGYINLHLEKRKFSRAGLRQAASWARHAAELLESAVTLDAPAGQGLLSEKGKASSDGGAHGTGKATGKSGA